MSRTLTSQEFNSLVQQLERMADGIDKHSVTGELPARMNAADRRARRQKLEDMRLKYEAAAREAALTYDAYADYFAECQSELAKDTDVVRGIFGKTNPVVNDFGAKTRTFRSGPAKAAKAMVAKA